MEEKELGDELLRKKAKVFNVTWHPEETPEEFYLLCLGEGEFAHNGYLYDIVDADPGWEVWIESLDGAQGKEHFTTRQELISQFRLRNDGRTVLEYICDYYHVPRILCPPLPEIYPDM